MHKGSCGAGIPRLSTGERFLLCIGCQHAIDKGLLHRVDQDNTYGGYLILKGSTIADNGWSIHVYPARHYKPTI